MTPNNIVTHTECVIQGKSYVAIRGKTYVFPLSIFKLAKNARGPACWRGH